MTKTKDICGLAILTALYVVLSAFLRFYVGVGHIQVDLGYLAFTVALCEYGLPGVFVGVVGCALESILFTEYGFSISWAVANAIIGVGCGIIFAKINKYWLRVVAIAGFCALGLIAAKTAIECYLYSIPVLVKLPKNLTAFAVDAIVMIFGLTLYKRLRRKEKA